ncbi:hypothetical protein ABEU97_20245 [Priestia megaterium]
MNKVTVKIEFVSKNTRKYLGSILKDFLIKDEKSLHMQVVALVNACYTGVHATYTIIEGEKE